MLRILFIRRARGERRRRSGKIIMKIRPITCDLDYRQAMNEIERLFDARPNTPEGDRLDALVTLVEAWEEKHFPIHPPDELK
jgi:HTH-type transcriptional regulator/antitoxin HigA